ncbi:protein SIEVE ELEMENT OCCLUSION B-like [Punica granatum]|uniref:Protein SIEVE ELEMENT OCCLUSION B-like n=2 Tax=Punica granatum TaxID=22663 RepID=A0A6P8CFR5_PUNGR|nr:protein SIEVE ELEMENT OCCLUSION B-like [Punica granatum]
MADTMPNMALTPKVPGASPAPAGSTAVARPTATSRPTAPAGPTATALQKYMRGGAPGERSMISMSDDNLMMKQVLETHSPDGLELDVRPLLLIVEDILTRATPSVDTLADGTTVAHMENLDEKTHQASFIAMMDALSFTIDRICCELSLKALSGGDAHSITLSIVKMLTSFPWDAKLVLTLAAFAFNYGEFWLLAQIYSTNQLAKSMAILKQLPVIMKQSGPLKPKFDALNNLIKAMLEVTWCVLQLKELPSPYISHDDPALSAAMSHVPTAVYWTIRSAVACATQITALTSMGHEYITSTTEAWELSTLAHKLKNISEHLQKQIDLCQQHIHEKKQLESFQNLLHLLDTIHIDNMKILKALIYPKDDIQPLIDGSTKRRVHIEVLRRKNVLLLISGLDISQEELSILEQIHSESKMHASRHENPYEVVWIPVFDRSKTQWTDEMQKQFEALQSTMPWYTVYHPSLIDQAVIRFIREIWHFRRKPILVVLDPQGKVVSPNAIHMMWIWGSNAFPFTTIREENLWREETWRLELLVNGIDPTILNWIREGKYIFLYGGDDIEWIRKFTATARQVAVAARIPLEMVYVGKSDKREQVRRTVTAITVEKLSYCWEDLAMIWFFWTRLESMLFSKIQLGKADDHDIVMQEIKRLLSYDKSGGWAVLAKGSSVVVNGHATTMLPTLVEYDLWKEHVPNKGYDLAFKDHHDKLHGIAYPCCRFEFPSAAGRIPEWMKCPECQRLMDKLTTFLCCHDDAKHGTISNLYD